MHKDNAQTLMNHRVSGPMLLGTGTVMGFAILQQGWIYVAALFGLFLLLLWPVQLALGGFAFLVPFDSSSALGTSANGISLTFVAGVVAVFALIAVGIIFRRFELPAKPALWWLLFVLWAAASVLWAYDQQEALRRLPTMFSLYLFYVVVTCFRLNEKEFSGIVTLTILGGCAAAVFSIFEFYNGISYHGLRGSLIIGNRATDPNIFAAGLLLPFSLAVSEFLLASALFRKVSMLLASGIIALAIFITMSRGAFLALAVMLLVYLRKLRMSWRILVPMFLLTGALVIVPNVLQRVQQSGATGGAGRIYIWQAGATAFKDFAFVGAGLNNFPVIYDRYASNADQFVGFHRDPHNIYLETGVELGTVGLALLLFAILSQLRMAKRVQPSLKGIPANLRAIACQAAAWGMLTTSFFLGMLWFKSFWLVWIMLTLASRERVIESPAYSFQYSALQPANAYQSVSG